MPEKFRGPRTNLSHNYQNIISPIYFPLKRKENGDPQNNFKEHYNLTINVPLILKMREIIFFCGQITLWAIFWERAGNKVDRIHIIHR
jgi:hypothetical protein